MSQDRFPSPFEVPTPEGAEGWEQMYNWYHLFGDDRRDLDEQRFWFQDRLHHPGVLHPYDEIQCECWWQALGAFNTRIFAMPPAFGVDQRILNGYLYVTPVPAPPESIPARAELFGRRGGHYYEHWDQIYAEWKEKVTTHLEEIKAIRFEPLPELEDESVVFDHVGYSSGYRMIEDFSKLVLTMYKTYQYHFELLNVGYAAYLTFFMFAKQAFGDITDQSISRMVGGLHVDLYRPDDELKRLAKEAERLGVGDAILDAGDPGSLFEELKASDGGREWVADWERTSDPWFLFNTDPGHPGGYHYFDTWLDDPGIPLASVKEYLRRLRAGEALDRPTDQVLAERDRITGEYRALLAPGDQEAFDEMVGLARKVFVYIEEHVLYIEHWMWATFWGKSKELSRALTAMGIFDDPEDMFFLRRYEVMEALYDTVAAWSVGSRARGADYWRPIVTERRRIHAALSAADAVPALGPPPAEVSEPFTVMLWGITTDTVGEWLREGQGDGDGQATLRGVAGSPGVVEGPARVVRHVSELDQVEEGEILVCPATSPSWSPVFSRIAATVSDVGGIMSHTAIICREYGLPAVIGTGKAVATIKTGQRIRVDGGEGVVTVLGRRRRRHRARVGTTGRVDRDRGPVDREGTSAPRSATLPDGGPATGVGGAWCALDLDPDPTPGGAPVDPDDWAVRRRRAVWRAAGARAGGRGAGRVPAAVVLDMGGVVIPTLFESVAVAGFPGGPLRGEVEYAAVERGDLPERDYWARLAERRPDLDVGALWRACSRVRGEVRGAMEAVAGRVRLVAFTNDMAHWFGPDWPGRFPELAGFDQVVEAARLGVLKPDPEAFRRCAAEIGEAPERCLFVDDLAVNLDGAAAVGMQTLLFEVRDPAASVAALLARLGLDPGPPPPGAGRVFSVR